MLIAIVPKSDCHVNIPHLGYPDPVSFRSEDRSLNSSEGHISQEGNHRDQEQQEPEDWTGEQDLHHARHVARHKLGGGPDVAIDQEEKEPEGDTPPNTAVAEPGPCIHLNPSF